MIYYYFGDKEGLYLSALENAYRTVREGEAKLDIEHLAAARGADAPGRVHLRPSSPARRLHPHGDDREHPSRRVSRAVEDHPPAQRDGDRPHREALCARRRRKACSGRDLDPIELHWQISALCFFNVSNRATFSKIFGRDFGAPDAQASLRKNVVDMVLRYVAAPTSCPPADRADARVLTGIVRDLL